jgi:hypothetical protein
MSCADMLAAEMMTAAKIRIIFFIVRIIAFMFYSCLIYKNSKKLF